MLREDMPLCPCGAHNWGGGGGYVGPGLAYTCFTCNACNRTALELHPWVFIERNPLNDPKATEMFEYLNTVIIPYRRATECKALIPPKLPDHLMAHMREDEKWRLVDHGESARVEIPPDPIAVRHRERWQPVREMFPQAREIPNRYYGDKQNLEPWYEMKVIDATIRFGPRKRVISIQVERGHPFYVETIAQQAKEDNTTFEADNQWLPHDKVKARSMEVHAWGMEKFYFYMAAIMFDLGRTHGLERSA